jgi:hypothetical protein
MRNLLTLKEMNVRFLFKVIDKQIERYKIQQKYNLLEKMLIDMIKPYLENN